MKKEIPIRNVYFLLSYAWGFISRGNEKALGTDNFTNASNLFAKLLDVTLEHLLKKGFANDYISREEAINGIKGRFELSSSIKSGTIANGKAICKFDEHGVDHFVNQIIKASITTLLKQKELDASNIDLLRRSLTRFHQVSDIKLHNSIFSKVKINNNIKHYRFVLELCRLINDCQVVSSESREVLLSNFMDDSLKMDRIFEKFVKNFYSYHLKDSLVSSPIYEWVIESSDHLFVDGIPELRTDVVIERGEERIIIDAKFYLEAMKQTFGGKFKFRRDHLSQLMEYMRTSQKRSTRKTYGMLLYPTVDNDINATGNIENFTLKIATVDLARNWDEIEEKLLSLVSVNNFYHLDKAA